MKKTRTIRAQEDEFLTPAEVAKIMRCKVYTVVEMARTKRLPSIRFGRGGKRDPVRFWRPDIEQFLEQRIRASHPFIEE